MKPAILPIVLLLFAMPAAAETVSGTVRVVDGDTLEIGERRIRLFGIDAPELRQTCERDGEAWACGEEAGRQLAMLVGDGRVDCAGDEDDEYGRLLAVCSIGSTGINEAMVRAGWATAFRRYSQNYVVAEIRARGERQGLWRSTFMLPEEYRIAEAERARPPVAQRPAPRAAAAPRRGGNQCAIKGNRNSRGEWIYHLPGRPYYAQTRAEEMFCTEEEALAAGYRRSKA